jgi:phospholipid/cholesterol/gamma-HCH transport system substrate-binding protein
MKLSREAKLGLIVTAGIALLFWGLNFLKGKDFFSSDKIVFALYNNVEGLSASNPVMVNGLKIGLIRGLKLLEDQSGRILVSMHVTNKVNLPKNSIAQIFSTDILGSKGIRIVMGDSKEYINDSDTLKSDVQKGLADEVGAQVAPIKAKAESLLSSMDSIMLTLRAVFNERTKMNLTRSFESISQSLASIESITGNLDTVLAGEGNLRLIFENLESITSNLKKNNDQITAVINNFAAISDTIARARISETLENTRRTLEQTANIMGKVNKGEGTLGQLANNDSLYHNLNSTARNLDLLLTDLRENPGHYVRLSLISVGGGKNKKGN